MKVGKLPQCFVRELDDKISSYVILRDPNDNEFEVEIPDGFSFEIEDNPGERAIQLTRKYEDDTITVQVEIPTVGPGQNEDDDVDDNEKNDSESSIPLVVNVFKGNGVCLEFGVTADTNSIV
ncbi:Mitochondrial glycoprotein family protein [Trifolium repens]|nr:Mitochondrial glycoprotein family protein [Trifolium repens]